MTRSLTVQKKDGFLPWRAHPGPETTMSELEAAISLLKLDILRTTDDEILLVQTAEAIRDGVPPPSTGELAVTMFGDDVDEAILVEDTGTFELPAIEDLLEPYMDGEEVAELIDAEARDRNAEGV